MIVASLDSATGGPARSVRGLSEAISHKGINVQLYVNKPKGVSRDQAGTSQQLFIKSIKQLYFTSAKTGQKRKGLTIIHNHGIWLPVNHIASAMARRCNIPIIISPRGMLEPWALNFRSWKKKIAWFFYQRKDLKSASVLHATSEQEARNLQSLGLNVPIAIIPNGVDVPELRDRKNEINNENKKIVLFLSRIHPKKGLINLVRAWSEIRPIDWELLVVGPDEGGHQIIVENEVKKYNLTDSFRFVGSVDDTEKWTIYQEANLFILPTHSENFGIVVAEALASGLPVITTKGAPWSELDRYKCGWWVDIGVEPLAQALREAINLSTSELQAMGNRGRDLVEQNYSWDHIAEEMILVYEWVLEGGTPPKCVMMV